MRCEICKKPFEHWEVLKWRTLVGLDYVCMDCVGQLVAEAAVAEPQSGVGCSRCERNGQTRQMECIDWLLCERCIEDIQEWAEGRLQGTSGLTAYLHAGSTAWARTVKVKCLSGSEAHEVEITVEKRRGSKLKQDNETTMLDSYIVSIDGKIRGILNFFEAETYDSAVWGVHLADLLECDNVVAIDGLDLGQWFSAE